MGIVNIERPGVDLAHVYGSTDIHSVLARYYSHAALLTKHGHYVHMLYTFPQWIHTKAPHSRSSYLRHVAVPHRHHVIGPSVECAGDELQRCRTNDAVHSVHHAQQAAGTGYKRGQVGGNALCGGVYCNEVDSIVGDDYI